MTEQAMQPVYLVKGDDASLVAQAVRGLIQSLVGARPTELVVEELADDAAIPDVLDACQTPAMLSDRRIIVVRNAGRYRADEVEPLLAYLSAPAPTTSLILVGGGGAIPTRLMKAIKEHGHVVDATVPAGKGKKEWLAAQLRQAPVNLDRGATELVADRLNEDFGQLQGLLDALAAAYGEGATLHAADVEPYVNSEGAAAPWELTDAIDEGDTGGALRQLRRMLNSDRHPLVVTATLQRHVTTLLRLDGANVTSDAEAATLLGVAPYPAKKALAQSRRLGSNAIARAVTLVADADVDLRGRSSWPAEMTLEVLVARLSKLAPRARRPLKPSR